MQFVRLASQAGGRAVRAVGIPVSHTRARSVRSLNASLGTQPSVVGSLAPNAFASLSPAPRSLGEGTLRLPILSPKCVFYAGNIDAIGGKLPQPSFLFHRHLSWHPGSGESIFRSLGHEVSDILMACVDSAKLYANLRIIH